MTRYFLVAAVWSPLNFWVKGNFGQLVHSKKCRAQTQGTVNKKGIHPEMQFPGRYVLSSVIKSNILG